MADAAILGSVVGSIGEHLISLLSKEIGLTGGVKLELQNLQSKLCVIDGVLRDAEKRQIDTQDKAWLKQLKQVAYDADDLLDDFSTEALRCRRTASMVRIFCSSSNQLVYAYKMAHRVMDINKRIEAIGKVKTDFELPRISNFQNMAEKGIKPQTYPYELEPYVIGRNQDKKEVINFLLNPDFEGNVSILSIVGIGGMGKTTLTRLVFNDEGVKESFRLKVWLCISTNFVVEDILRKIVEECIGKNESAFEECIGKNESASLNINELYKKLDALLSGKRFLLVLDDVWNDDGRKWLNLQGYLNCGARGSKILVTTRTSRVAKTMAANSHELSGLSEVESLSLLMRMAMKKEHEWKNQNLETIAKDILKKCAGVPLAITTFGRLLLHRGNTEEEWLRFKNYDLARLPQNEDDILPSLKLSYDDLPLHLKPCFAYCSLFPKDCEIDAPEIIRLWMAQGFIKHSQNKELTLEGVGQEYFMELVSRNFFQDLKPDIFGDVEFKMHDLMHDLAISVAGDNCTAIDSSPAPAVPQEARHISIIGVNNDHAELKELESNGRIRSLLCSYIWSTRCERLSLVFSRFRNLRALCLSGISMYVPRSIGKMKHLRSLDLSGNLRLRCLPNSIGKLCNLETLVLRDCMELKSLPRGITKLVNLRHIDIDGCASVTHMPRGIGKLTNLQMLSTFVVGDKKNSKAARLGELGRLTGLRKSLELRRLENVSGEVDASCSMEKFNLQDLALHWSEHDKQSKYKVEEVLERFKPNENHLKSLRIHDYLGNKLSSWIIQMKKLVHIRIAGCNHVRHIPPLDHLPFLKKIFLTKFENLEWIELSENGMQQQSNLYPSLEAVNLHHLPKFKGWERRRINVNGTEKEGMQEDEDEEDSSSFMLPFFSDKVTVESSYCERFSFMNAHLLHLGGVKHKLLQELSGSASNTSPPSTRMAFIPISSITLPMLTSLTLSGLEDTELLSAELFQSLSSLRSLVIYSCPRLESLSGRTILIYLTSLESLEISHCDNFDFDHLKELSPVQVDNCCPLDQQGNPTSQLCTSTKLRELKFESLKKMKTLPWWIQHLSNLESLELEDCENVKALPEWFSQLISLNSLTVTNCGELTKRCQRDTGEEWPKISHIQFVVVDEFAPFLPSQSPEMILQQYAEFYRRQNMMK